MSFVTTGLARSSLIAFCGLLCEVRIDAAKRTDTVLFVVDRDFSGPEGHGFLVEQEARRSFDGTVKTMETSDGCDRALSEVLHFVRNHPDTGVVVNMSWSVPERTGLEQLLQALQSRGVLLVGAAGNEGVNRCDYPSSSPTALAVGSSLVGKPLRTSYSNWGRCVAFWAGDLDASRVDDLVVQAKLAIRTGAASAETAEKLMRDEINKMHLQEGTSFAAPQIAGALATLLQSTHASSDEVVSALKDKTRPSAATLQLMLGLPDTRGFIVAEPVYSKIVEDARFELIVPELIDAAEGADPPTSDVAVGALSKETAKVKSAKLAKVLNEHLDSRVPYVRAWCAFQLGRAGVSRDYGHILNLLHDRDPMVIEAAIRALAELGQPEALVEIRRVENISTEIHKCKDEAISVLLPIQKRNDRLAVIKKGGILSWIPRLQVWWGDADPNSKGLVLGLVVTGLASVFIAFVGWRIRRRLTGS